MWSIIPSEIENVAIVSGSAMIEMSPFTITPVKVVAPTKASKAEVKVEAAKKGKAVATKAEEAKDAKELKGKKGKATEVVAVVEEEKKRGRKAKVTE